MPPPPRSRGRRDRRGGDPDDRLRRTLESQQAAYEAYRAVIAVAAARRDADWREAAQANRRRALAALGAPLLLGVILIALGVIALPLLIAGAVVTVLWAFTAVRIWRRPAAGILRDLGGLVPDEGVARGLITITEAERVTDVAEGLCAALGLPVPGILIIEGAIPNALAFGSGPDDATLILTSGLARAFDRIELEAVLAHELVHVKRLDVLTAAFAASGLGTVGDALSGRRFGTWLQGQDREIRADIAAVMTTRYPPGLITALEQISALEGSRSDEPLDPVERVEGDHAGRPRRQVAVPDDRVLRRVEMSWLAPVPTGPNRPPRRDETELDVRLDVLREL